MTAWCFELHRGLDTISQFLPYKEWEKFFINADSATMSHHPALILNWYRSFGKLWQREPLLVLAQMGTRQVIFPLEMTKEKWKGLTTRLLTPVGGAFNFDFQDPLVSGDNWNREEKESFWTGFNTFVRHAVKDCDRVVLYRLRHEMAGDSAQLKESTVCPYLDLAEKKSLDEVLADCHSNHRSATKRRMRKLAKEGELSVRLFGPSEMAPAEEALLQYFQAYDEQWSPKGSHAFETALGRSFLEGVMRDLLPTGLMHFSVLYCGATPVHWHLGFLFRNRFYFYKPARNSDWSNYSPGRVHIALLIEGCIRTGIRFFDFLYGDESYKFSWTSQTYTLYRREWWNGIRPVKRCVKEVIRPGYRAVKKILSAIR